MARKLFSPGSSGGSGKRVVRGSRSKFGGSGGSSRFSPAKSGAGKRVVKPAQKATVSSAIRALSQQRPASKRVVRPYQAPAAQRSYSTPSYSAPSYNTSSYRGGSTGGTSSYSGGATAPAPVAPVEPPKPVVPSTEEWASGDSTYQALLASLKKQMENYNTDYNTQLSDYDTNLRSSFSDLGYQNFGDNFSGGRWSVDDLNTASGRGYNNLTNDFAARGLLQGSEYANSRNDFQRTLDDQLSQLTSGRDQFRTNMGNQRTSYLDSQNEAKRNAYNESVARRAAKYGLT